MQLFSWILDENKFPIPATLLEAAAFGNNSDNVTVARDIIAGHHVMTDFIGWLFLLHNENEMPVAFETLVQYDDECITVQYSSYEEALAGHKEICDKLRKGERQL